MIKKFHSLLLSDWLTHLESGMAGGQIEMGLARVEAVRKQLTLVPRCPVVMVAGTNGKGSVCAYLTQIYQEAGYRVGTLTSPHLLIFNERIAINGQPAGDDEIVAAFEAIETGRTDVALTYFEFNTLAAVLIFNQQQVDIMILEVGLGGRLDAVNIFDADVSVITNVDLDHQAYLGDTIEQIAFEKAGVMRAGKPIIVGQQSISPILTACAQDIGADFLLVGRDFAYQKQEKSLWLYCFHPQYSQLLTGKQVQYDLPLPALHGDFQLNNAACALTVLECLKDRLPVKIAALRHGLLKVNHPGRLQVVANKPLTVLDVGHNPHAACAMRNSLLTMPEAEKRLAVFSMLVDKDIDAVLDILRDQFDEWLIAPLSLPRGMSVDSIEEKFIKHNINQMVSYDNIQLAYQAALSKAGENDRIIVFGSFHTVAEVMTLL